MNWQIIPYSDIDNHTGESIKLDNYKILSKIGARLHNNPVMACWEYRLAQFAFGIQTKPEMIGHGFKIPIPWMQNDHGVGLRVY